MIAGRIIAKSIQELRINLSAFINRDTILQPAGHQIQPVVFDHLGAHVHDLLEGHSQQDQRNQALHPHGFVSGDA